MRQSSGRTVERPQHRLQITIKIRNRSSKIYQTATHQKNAAATIPIDKKNLIMLDGQGVERQSSSYSKCIVTTAFVVLLIFIGAWQSYLTEESTLRVFKWNGQASLRDESSHDGKYGIYRSGDVINTLLQNGVYNKTDFINEIHIVPPYWTNGSVLDHPTETKTTSVGPCFLPNTPVHWDEPIEGNRFYPTSGVGLEKNDWANYCLPGFLIIGAGKCGTSSLYHYLTDHPKILPASMKQIHYFKYYPDRPMKWYLSHFPTTVSFLSSGAIMTGEASPGYLPYPDVAAMVRQRLPNNPRIIAIGREPIDRAYSSYRYNYVSPTIDTMRKGAMRGIQKDQPDAYYHEFLFSFEDMIRAELKMLRECLSIPNGSAVAGARDSWGVKSWAVKEYERRDTVGLDPLVDLDGHCYGGPVNLTIARKQWISLYAKYPKKVIPSNNVHLTQAMVGRGLYTFPLEWWYAVFNSSDVYFVCTEELKDMTGEPLNKLGQFLGLHSFNFSQIVSGGAYNVGSHHGYDKEVSWNELEKENMINSSDGVNAITETIPLSELVRRDLEEFVRPYNERLFKLVGRRCNW